MFQVFPYDLNVKALLSCKCNTQSTQTHFPHPTLSRLIADDLELSASKMVDRPEFLHVNIENNPEYTTNLALFTNVSNSDELRRLIVEGQVEAALLNACMVCTMI